MKTFKTTSTPPPTKMTGSTTEKYLVAVFLIFAAFLISLFNLPNQVVFASEKSYDPNQKVLGESVTPESDNQEITVTQPIKTQSSFITKIKPEVTTLPFEIVAKDDPEREYGEETVLQEGVEGKNTKLFQITYARSESDPEEAGEEFDREIVSDETIAPKDKIVSKGTKIVWRTLDTPEGQISYWRKMRVYATHYDKYCLGCNDWTAIGMRAGKGVIAVDPRVIKMRSQVYVPGYGKAIAGDTGGAIKGNIIDLGYDDARTAGWSARYVDIYLLDKAPL